jgi:hypothetical protein
MEKEKVENLEIFLEKENPEKFDTKLQKLRQQETRHEVEGRTRANKLRDAYKAKLVRLEIESGEKFKQMPKEMEEALSREFQEIDKEYTTEAGVHFLKCHFSKIIDALRDGKRVEFEAVGPYLRDYIASGFDTENIEYATADKTGLAIMEFLRKEVMPEAHPVSLYDEYNMGLSSNEKVTGLPTDVSKQGFDSEVGQREVSDTFKIKFKEFVETLMRKKDIIKEGEKEGPESDFVLISETEKTKDAPKLVEALEKRELIEYGEGKEIWFQNTIKNCEDPRYLRINLRDKKGKWQCAALDSSGFLNPRNQEITHLVILPKPSKKNLEKSNKDVNKLADFEEQQDQVWEILYSLGFQPNNYHNIFFEVDEKYEKKEEPFNPQSIVDSIRSQIKVLL